MGNRIRLENHHSLEDLEYSYHSSRCAVFTRHVLVLSLVLKDYSTQQICDITHLSENWVYTICKRYNEGGLKALRIPAGLAGGRGRRFQSHVQ